MPDGLLAIVWCYPVAVLSYVFLSRRAAGAYSAVLLAAVGLVIDRRAGAASAATFAFSLAFVAVLMARMLRAHDQVRQALADQTLTDPLTGAFNRRHLDACLTIAIERQNRSGEPSALMLLDVDHFKAINDALGHAAGDDVLKGLVRLIGSRMRSIDILFRTGGEEFALLLGGARYADAMVVAEDLRLLVEDSRLIDAGRISISIGVSEVQRGLSAHAWLADADKALYRAKRGGRNRVAGRAFASAS